MVGMFRALFVGGLALTALIVPAQAADLLPHEASYVVRLGTSRTAPEIGTARQLLGLDCQVWRLERDVVTDIALAASLRLTSESELRGAEPRDGKAFDYQLRRAQNGRAQSIGGRVAVGASGARAVLSLLAGPTTVELPASTVLPVAGFGRVVAALKGGATSFSFALYDPELTSDALRVEGGVIAADSLRPPPREATKLPAGKAWPVEIAFTRPRAPERPLFALTLLLHEGGVLDRLTINTGLIAASADLVAFKPLPRPECPNS
jgi:hypothetical protein